MFDSRHTTLRTWLLSMLAVAFLAPGCAELPPAEMPSPEKGGLLITHDEIEQSRARDAWEAIRRNVNHLRFVEDVHGDPVWVGAVRGNQSLVAPDEVLLVVDGTTMAQGPRYLRQIPAKSVLYIRILSSAQGTAEYGMAGGNGVVIVKTFSPTRPIANLERD